MTTSPIDPSTGPAEERLEDSQTKERVETDSEQEPNAPHREPVQEPVRHDD